MNKLTWSEVEKRIAAARALADNHYTVLQPEPGLNVYTVLNGDQAQYTVSFVDVPTGTCDCPDFMNRGPACKHTALVVLSQWPSRLDKWQEKVQALCAPEEPEAPAEEAPPPESGPQDDGQAADDDPSPDLHTVILEAVEVAVADALIALLVKPLTAAIAPEVERIVLDLRARQ